MIGPYRRLLATLLLLGVGLAVLSTGSSAAAQPAAGRDALQALSSCVQSTNKLLVLMLIDESGSLARTDHSNQRVTAVKATLRNLAAFTTMKRAGGAPRVEVRLAGFSVDFKSPAGWTQLGPGTIGKLERNTDGFAKRNTGKDTDFYLALEGTRRAFGERVQQLTSQGDAAPCQLLLLFTDGEYDVDPRPGSTKSYAPSIKLNDEVAARRVVALGHRRVCDPGGTIDQLRLNGVVTVTIALTAELGRQPQGFLQALGTGAGGGQTCGKEGSRVTGAFFPVRQLRELLFRFDQIANELVPGKAIGKAPSVSLSASAPPANAAGGPSPSTQACDGSTSWPISGAPASYWSCRPPTGPKAGAALGAGRQRPVGLGHYQLVLAIVAGRHDRRRAPSGTDDWVGTWSVTFIDPSGRHPGAVARSQIYLYGDLSPELAEPSVLRLGQENRLTVQLVNQDHTPRTPADLLATASLVARVLAQSTGQSKAVPMVPDPQGRWHGTYAVPADTTDAGLDIELGLTVRTRSGVTLATVRRVKRLPVKPPVSYPDVSPTELRLPGITGTDTARGVLRVTGGSTGTSCVWFEPATFSVVPPQAGAITLQLKDNPTTADRCISVGPGDIRDVTIEARPDQQDIGRVEGRLVARLISGEPDAPVLSKQIPVTFRLALKVNEVERGVKFLLLAALLLLLPLVVLYLFGLGYGWFQPTTTLRGAVLPVVLGTDGRPYVVNDAGGTTSLEHIDFGHFTKNVGNSSARRRRLSWPPLAFRIRVPWHPFDGPHGIAEHPTLHTTGSGGQQRRRGSGLIAGRVPLELSGAWVCTLDPAELRPDGEVRGTLYLMLNELREWTPEPLQRLVEELGERLGPAMQKLDGTGGSTSAEQAPGGDGGPATAEPRTAGPSEDIEIGRDAGRWDRHEDEQFAQTAAATRDDQVASRRSRTHWRRPPADDLDDDLDEARWRRDEPEE